MSDLGGRCERRLHRRRAGLRRPPAGRPRRTSIASRPRMMRGVLSLCRQRQHRRQAAILERWLADGRRGQVIDLGPLEARLPKRTERLAHIRNTGLDEIARREGCRPRPSRDRRSRRRPRRACRPTASSQAAALARCGAGARRRPRQCHAALLRRLGASPRSLVPATTAGIRSGADRPTSCSRRPSSARSSRARSRFPPSRRRSPCARRSAASASIACPPRSPPAMRHRPAGTRDVRARRLQRGDRPGGRAASYLSGAPGDAPRQHLYQPAEFKLALAHGDDGPAVAEIATSAVAESRRRAMKS